MVYNIFLYNIQHTILHVQRYTTSDIILRYFRKIRQNYIVLLLYAQ